MGYRSMIMFKTTSEGYALMKHFNDTLDVKNEYDRPLDGLKIEKTSLGYYRISHPDIKWYDSYEQVKNFNKALDLLEDQDVPYKFIRLGEDIEGIEEKDNWTEEYDKDDSFLEFNPVVSINDPDESNYETIKDERWD